MRKKLSSHICISDNEQEFHRIYNFVCNFSIINNSQNGFMKGWLTENVIVDLTEINYKTLDSKQCGINILIDFRRAFDTIDHHILLTK